MADPVLAAVHFDLSDCAILDYGQYSDVAALVGENG